MARAGAISTHPEAHEVAAEILREDGSALKAALAGFFAAAGGDGRVLWSPVTLLLGGGGGGTRAFDGRCRQPGVGARRPRGWTSGETIPDAAYAAVPASVAAIAVACAYGSGATLPSVVRYGVGAARRVGARKRVSLLERVSAVGAAVLNDPLVKSTLLGEFGPAQGGVISVGDLAPPKDLDCPALEVDSCRMPPWSREPVAVEDVDGESHVVCAVDVRGAFVGVAFSVCRNGLELDALDVVLPKVARPVLRGVPRTSPGAPLPAAAPLAMRLGSRGQPVELLASPRSLDLGRPEIVLRRDPESLEVSLSRH